MTFTPFEREMLKRADRTNELLELLVMAHQPMKIQTGMMTAEEAAAKLDQTLPGGNWTVGQLTGDGGVSFGEQALAAAGITPMRRPVRRGEPETEEQRAARFAARAKEVGLSDEAAAAASGRVKTNLDTLLPADQVTKVTIEPGPAGAVSDEPTPAPAKRARKTVGSA